MQTLLTWPMPGFVRAAVSMLLSLLLVVTLAVADRSPAQAAESACPAGELSAADELSASALAVECEARVEVISGREFTQKQFAEPDGSFTLRSHARPRWAYDREGRWVEADAALSRDGSGRIATAATPIELVVSPGGNEPLVTAADHRGRSMSVRWPDELPEPVLDGEVATYPDVFDGVDLQVIAGVDAFSYALVVHTPQAARLPELAEVDVQVTADGLEVAQLDDGTVAVVDSAGDAVFAAARAQMWDSSSAQPAPAAAGLRGGDVPDAEPGRLVDVEMALDGGALRVVPDRGLLTDPTTEFPVTIDPTFSATRLAWTNVGSHAYAGETWWDDNAWPREDGLRMGYLGWVDPPGDGYGVWRAMARFDTGVARGAVINSAEAELTVYHTGGCDGPFPVELWRTEPIEQGAVPTSWDSTSGSWLQELDVTDVPSANSYGNWCDPRPERDVTWDGAGVRQAVQDVAAAGGGSVTLGLRAADESDMMAWMRAYPESYALEVNYTPVTAVPQELDTDGVGCLAPAGSRVAGSEPVLSGVPRHSEGQVQARVELRTAGGAENLHEWLSEPVTSGQEVSWQVDQELPDEEYRWRMRSEDPDSSATSSWSGWCEFTADALLEQEPPASEQPMECPVDSGEPLETTHEAVALQLAQLCDEPVEVLADVTSGCGCWHSPKGTW